MPNVRENAGRHEYDGMVQDLSPSGVRDGLARLARARAEGPAEGDSQDEAHLAAFEDVLQVSLGELEEHRGNPLVHIDNLDLAAYDRAYAPEEQRDEARRRHLAAWPDGVDAAIQSLDRLTAPVARALASAVRGLAAAVEGKDAIEEKALAAHARLVAHIEDAAEHGGSDP